MEQQELESVANKKKPQTPSQILIILQNISFKVPTGSQGFFLARYNVIASDQLC